MAPIRLKQTGRTSDNADATLRPGDPPSVVDPERFTAADPPSGSWPRLTPSVSDPARWPAAAFQSALPPAVLSPESFRGGCSFGAAHPGLHQGATSPAGVHTAAPCLAPAGSRSQYVTAAIDCEAYSSRSALVSIQRHGFTRSCRIRTI